jgi:hypothetical protein
MQPKPNNHKGHMQPFQMPICIYHMQDCLPAPVYADVLLFECPVSSPIITCTWFTLKLSNSLALLAEGHLRKLLACFCPWIPVFLFVQDLIPSLVNFADMSRVGSGPLSGHEEPCLAKWSAVSFPSISHMSWQPHQLNPGMFFQFYEGLTAFPD